MEVLVSSSSPQKLALLFLVALSSSSCSDAVDERDVDIDVPAVAEEEARSLVRRHRCGDGRCRNGETCSSCSADCGTCPADEGGPSSCGDLVCDGNDGEMCTTCATDCKTTSPVCGNGACDDGETSSSCYGDCGPAPWPADWAAFEDEVLLLVNQHRAAGTDCPSGARAPVAPLTKELPLETAARLHSWDQSYSGYGGHTSCNGRSPWTRARAQGTEADGEVVAGGFTTPSSVVSAWMASTTGHCEILMNPYNTVIGVGHAAPGRPIWTAMLR